MLFFKHLNVAQPEQYPWYCVSVWKAWVNFGPDPSLLHPTPSLPPIYDPNGIAYFVMSLNLLLSGVGFTRFSVRHA